MYVFQSSLYPFPNDTIISPPTEESSGGKQMEHLCMALYPCPACNVLRTSAVLTCASTKATVYSLWATQTLWKHLSCLEDWNRSTNRNVLTPAQEQSPTVDLGNLLNIFASFLSVSLSCATGHWLRKETENSSFVRYFGEIKRSVILLALFPSHKRAHLHLNAAFSPAFYPYVKYSMNIWDEAEQHKRTRIKTYSICFPEAL